MAGRFPLLTDEHFPTAVIKALVDAKWSVQRVVDVLGQETPDELIFEYAAREGRIFATSDERAQAMAIDRVERGLPLAGMIVWPQRHRRRISAGDFLRFCEELAQEDDPFAYGIRHIKPQ